MQAQTAEKAGTVKPPPIPARPAGLYQPLSNTDSPSSGSTLTQQFQTLNAHHANQFEMKDLKHGNSVHSKPNVLKPAVSQTKIFSKTSVTIPGPLSSVDTVGEKEKWKEPLSVQTPSRRIVNDNGHAKAKLVSHHSFFSDGTEVRNMEGALLELLDDFRSGKLRAFGNDGSLEQMVAIRDQQERLAKMHFDLLLRQHSKKPNTLETSEKNSAENMKELITGLEQLSVAIERLHSSTEGQGETPSEKL